MVLGGLLVVDGFGCELNDDGDGDEGVDQDRDDGGLLSCVGCDVKAEPIVK